MLLHKGMIETNNIFTMSTLNETKRITSAFFRKRKGQTILRRGKEFLGLLLYISCGMPGILNEWNEARGRKLEVS